MSGKSLPINDQRKKERDTSLYHRFLAEREQVLKHKWIESERLGEDIGWEFALIDWVKNHRKNWIEAVKAGKPAR